MSGSACLIGMIFVCNVRMPECKDNTLKGKLLCNVKLVA